MLFDEQELKELDRIAVKNTVQQEKLVKKPSPLIKQWIGINYVGQIFVMKKPKEKGILTILEVESMDIVNEVLSAVKQAKGNSLYSHGNHYIPNWKNTGMASGFSSSNLIQANSWLAKVISALGYGKRNTYTIVNEPSDVMAKLQTLKGQTPEQLKKSNHELTEFMKTLDEEKKRKQEEEQMRMEAEVEKMKAKQAETLADLNEQQLYQQHRRSFEYGGV